MWEYKIIYLPINDKEEALNFIGIDKWELVSVDNGIAFFKRQWVRPPSIRIRCKKKEGTEQDITQLLGKGLND